MRLRLEYALVRAVSAVVRVLPLKAVRVCGTALGHAVYRIDRFHRRIAVQNLSQAFPARPASEIEAVARAMFAHFGCVLLELLKSEYLSNQDLMRLSDTEGEERVRQAHARGKGVLLFTGHFGYWEMNGITHALRLQPISVLARPLDNPYLDAMLERIRTRTGNSVIRRQGAMRKVLRALGANQAVAMLIDQHLHTPDAVYVDFFKRPAATTSALAALALRTGAVVIPVFALPTQHGYRFIYEAPVDPPAPGSPDAIREFTQRCTDVLEMYVRRHPELWMWMHRRWREREPALADRDLSLDEAEADA